MPDEPDIKKAEPILTARDKASAVALTLSGVTIVIWGLLAHDTRRVWDGFTFIAIVAFVVVASLFIRHCNAKAKVRQTDTEAQR